MDKTRFQGIIAPIVNPCGEDDELDVQALRNNMERLLNTGISGLYINGGTGDAAKLSDAERKITAEILVPAAKAAGKTAIVHVGQTNQRAAVCLARHAAALGADAVASIPPKEDWAQIVEYYRALAATGAPVIVYYIPGVTGMTAGIKELKMLMDIPGVIGIKMSDFNIFLLRSLTLLYPDKVIYSGFDEMLVPGLMYGADGAIGTWANLLPETYAAVYFHVRAGKIDAVKDIMDEFTAFLALAWKKGVIDSFEELMHELHYAGRCFRRPSSWNPGKLTQSEIDALLLKLRRMKEMTAALEGRGE